MDIFRVNSENQRSNAHIPRTFSLSPEDDQKILEISRQKDISVKINIEKDGGPYRLIGATCLVSDNLAKG